MSDAAIQYAPTLPKAVREAAARADQVQRDSNAANAAAHQPGGAPTTVVDVAQPVNAPPPAPAADDTWEAKFRTLQGKYDREIADANNGRRTLAQQIQTLQTQVQSLQSLLANSRQQAAPAPAPATDVSEEDRTEYGELVQKARNWARAEMGQEISDLKAQLQQLSGQTQQTNQMTIRQRIENALDAWQARTGHDWNNVNNDHKFIDWLGANDPFAGRARKDLLGEAYRAGDASRVVHFFDAFTAEQAALTGQQPNPGHQDTQHAPAAGSPGKVPLETLAAPGRGAPGGAPAQPNKRIWTPRDVQQFYEARKRGQYRGREQEAAALEKDLFAAQTDGRYRPT